jgi:AcrR family transcriptional regulator
LGRGGRPTRAEAEKRRQHLIEIAGAMFMKLGFDGTSIDAVAEAACMSKRTVYARYRDKNELFSALHTTSALAPATKTSPRITIAVSYFSCPSFLLRWG